MDIVLHLLAAYGICFGLMNEKLSPLNRGLYRIPVLRDGGGANVFERMLSCSYCTGFHCGWIVWLASNFSGVASVQGILQTLQFAFASSAFCYTVDSLVRLSDYAAEALARRSESEGE